MTTETVTLTFRNRNSEAEVREEILATEPEGTEIVKVYRDGLTEARINFTYKIFKAEIIRPAIITAACAR